MLEDSRDLHLWGVRCWFEDGCVLPMRGSICAPARAESRVGRRERHTSDASEIWYIEGQQEFIIDLISDLFSPSFVRPGFWRN